MSLRDPRHPLYLKNDAVIRPWAMDEARRAMAIPPEKREQLLARVSDLLRRAGTEDAERLIRDLETVFVGPVFSGDGNVTFAFHASIPAGDILSDRRILQIFAPEFCATFTTRGVFPFPFGCQEAHAGISGSPEVPTGALYWVLRDNGSEISRLPFDAFTGAFAISWKRRYDHTTVHEIELWAPRPFHSTVPWSVVLMLSGKRV